VIDETTALQLQVARQVAHWRAATLALQDPENFASASAWAGLERYLGIALRGHLRAVVGRLAGEARELQRALAGARTEDDLERLRRRVVGFRRRFLRAETVLDFYGDAVSTRTSPRLARLLGACDALAVRSMEQALRPLGIPVPPVLTYVDKGLGASILRAGIRLWDGGSPSAVAAVKIARHNLVRPTALIHEAGHQVAHLTGFNDELAAVLRLELTSGSSDLAATWESWASEIAADAFAFVTTGYGSAAALHDVLAGDEATVFRHLPGDPHPIAYLRVLLVTEMCRRFYRTGPWDDLASAWMRVHPIANAAGDTRALIEGSLELLPRVAALTLSRPMRAFGGRALGELVDPQAVKPDRLDELEREAGAALYTSPHWLQREPLRLLALGSLRAATAPDRSPELAALQENWMIRLGKGAGPHAMAA
jgi:hypothetical protein